jgi:hypothetical protein
VFNSISKLKEVKGHLPINIGNLTELIELNFQESDLSAGPVPDSIGLCTKLVKVILNSCKLQGEFPMGIRTLKSLGNAYNGLEVYTRMDWKSDYTRLPLSWL